MSEIDPDSATAPEAWPAGGPPRPMTEQEAELRAEWTETFQQMTLRVGAMACTAVTVRLPSGDEAIGTAFHVGEGVYLTARHVVEGNTILALMPHTGGWLFRDELTVEAPTGGRLNGEIPMWRIHH